MKRVAFAVGVILLISILFYLGGRIDDMWAHYADRKAVERTVSRNLLPSPSPTVVTTTTPVTDPEVIRRLEELQKEVQSLR